MEFPRNSSTRVGIWAAEPAVQLKAGHGRADQRDRHRRCDPAREENEVTQAHQHQRQGRQEHRHGVGQEGNHEIADQQGAGEAAQRADRGQPSHIGADPGHGAGNDPDQERPGHGQQRQRQKKQERGRQQRTRRQAVERVQAPISHRPAQQHGEGQVDRPAQDGPIEPRQPLRTVRQPSAGVISAGQRHQRDRNLRRPHEM